MNLIIRPSQVMKQEKFYTVLLKLPVMETTVIRSISLLLTQRLANLSKVRACFFIQNFSFIFFYSYLLNYVLGTSCQVCTVTVDQNEEMVGVGQYNCWTGSNEYLTECAPNSYCIVDMEIDWFSRGDFNYRVVRGCSPEPAQETCYEASGNVQVSC